MRVFLLNTPDVKKPINRDMAGGLGFDRSRTTVLPPLDLLSYATTLEQNGCQITLFDAQIESLSREQIRQLVSRFEPDVVILTLSLPSLDNDIAFARYLKNNGSFNAEIIFKTNVRYPSIIQRVLKESECSYCIIGECDLIIGQILTGETSHGTARLSDGKYVEESEHLLDDLDLLPNFNRKHLKNERYCYPVLGPKTTTMQTSRGCPFKCSYYCPYPLVQGKKWRAMSASRIVQELKTIVQEEHITNVFFRDATFTVDKKRIRELCRLIQEQCLKFSWWCETRVDCLDIDLVDAMQKAGCSGLNIGVETGSENLLASQAKKGVTVSDITELSQHCKGRGVKMRFLLMLGLPGETKQTLYETFMLVSQLQPDYIGVTTVTPYPGTPFYDEAIEENWIINPDINTFGGHGYNMKIGSLIPDDLRFAMEKIHAVHGIERMESSSADRCRKKIQDEFLEWAGN